MKPELWQNRIVGHEDVPPDQLLAHEKNFRRHPGPQQSALSGAIAELGFTSPVLVQAGSDRVIDGHLRVELALRENQPTIPVTYVDLTDEETDLALVTMDPLSALAFHDQEQLDALLAGLSSDDAAIQALLDSLSAEPIITPGLTDPDDVPPVPEVPVTKPGDLWLLGRHRLLAGDATNAADVERLMGGEQADMVFTDPPYGMNLDTSFKNSHANSLKNVKASKGYTRLIGDDAPFDPSFLIEFFKATDEQFWWGADYYRSRLPEGGSWLVWDKRDGMDVDWTAAEFELCWSRQAHHRRIIRHRWFGLIGTEQEDTHKRLHPTQKPVGLSVDCLNEWSKPDDLVLDLFGGSGSTLIACEQTNRRCAMMEILPAYCDVVVQRWEQFTGQTATLAHDPALAVT